MKLKLFAISVITVLFMSTLVPYTAYATVQKGNNGSMNFDIDLTGYRLYGFGDFNQLGYKITPLAQLYFTIIQLEEEWIDEPQLYIKGNKGYVHLRLTKAKSTIIINSNLFMGVIKMKIYVDADACPVKDIIISEGTNAEIPVVLVTSFSHFSNAEEPSGVEKIYVDSGADAADYRIMKLAEKGDIIVTQDYGLASLGLAKGCTVLHHKGYSYTNENIDQLLQTRYLSAMARKSGKRTKGPKPFTSEDKEKFKELFKRVISL